MWGQNDVVWNTSWFGRYTRDCLNSKKGLWKQTVHWSIMIGTYLEWEARLETLDESRDPRPWKFSWDPRFEI